MSNFFLSFCLFDRLRTYSLVLETMKNRSLAGNCGIGVFVIALVTVALAFGTPSWLVSDYRIRGARLDRY